MYKFYWHKTGKNMLYNFLIYRVLFTKLMLNCLLSTTIMIHDTKLVDIHVLGVSGKKNGVADYQYFKNDNMQQCDIIRHGKYNFHLASTCV